jgi:hypothetical protein
MRDICLSYKNKEIVNQSSKYIVPEKECRITKYKQNGYEFIYFYKSKEEAEKYLNDNNEWNDKTYALNVIEDQKGTIQKIDAMLSSNLKTCPNVFDEDDDEDFILELLRKIKLANKFDYNVSFYGIDLFESRSLGKINFEGLKEIDIGYKNNLANETILESGVVDDKDKYSKLIKAKLELNNLDYENIYTYENDFMFIYDTISDESDRLKSSTEEVYEPVSYDSEQSLLDNNELQLLRGNYRYPQLDFSEYGELDYSSCEGMRYVTKAFELENANHFILNFTNLYNSKPIVDNEMSIDMYVDKDAIIHSDEEIKYNSWISINKPFSGVSSCFYIEDAGAIEMSKSDVKSKYITFGPVSLTGKIYIRIGLKKGSNIVFNF